MTRSQRSIRRATKAAICVLAIGTFGYMWVEGWTFWKSLFFTVITITTVGYGDYGLSEAGMRFTAVMLVLGVGTMTYALGQLIPVFFNEKAAQERAVKNRIRKLSNHFIVCGLGRVGRACCKSLAQKGVPFVCVDTDEATVAWAHERDYLALHGDATRDEMLQTAGVRWARGLASVTESDTENIVITLGARQLNPELHIVSRAEHTDSFHKMQRAGASRVISPVHAGGENIAGAMVNPVCAQLFESQTDRGIEISELEIAGQSALAGRSIADCGAEHEAVVFIGLARGDAPMKVNPRGDARLEPGDVLVAGGDAIAIGRLQDAARALPAAA